MDGCVQGGGFIKVAAGHYFSLEHPDPDLIEIWSISEALGKICRYGGHCPRFYSVAEHCVHAVEQAELDGHSNKALMAILLHDAAEAYVGDMVRPLKAINPEYKRIEGKVEDAICERFEVKLDDFYTTIKLYDLILMKAEKKHFWPEDTQEWTGLEDIPDRDVPFACWVPERASYWYRSTFERILKCQARIG